LGSSHGLELSKKSAASCNGRVGPILFDVQMDKTHDQDGEHGAKANEIGEKVWWAGEKKKRLVRSTFCT